jgi:hypothetical protein
MCPENVPKCARFQMFSFSLVQNLSKILHNISHLEDDQQLITVITINYPSLN